MRVPDVVRKCVVFVGQRGIKAHQWRATAFFLIAWEKIEKAPGGALGFGYLVTARHVAERLEGGDWAYRANTRGGSTRIIDVPEGTRWWFHPTERREVDAAVALFPSPFAQFPTDDELDITAVPWEMSATKRVITERDLGAGDEVFMTGLFNRLVETSRNIPIIRTGNIAALPGEMVPFDNELRHAYLIETRSIGGLSGSPVFVRETVSTAVTKAANQSLPAGTLREISVRPRPPLIDPKDGFLYGVGDYFFLGSVVGHWSVKPAAVDEPEQEEKVNMGISLVTPATKILEIIMQPELAEMRRRTLASLRPI